MEKDRSAISTPGVGLRPSSRQRWHVHGTLELLEGRSVSFLVLPSSLSFSLLLTPLSPLSFQVLFNVRPSSRWEMLLKTLPVQHNRRTPSVPFRDCVGVVQNSVVRM